MASHGSKFVSVNLNKSYGQKHQPSDHALFNGGSSSYGPFGGGRGRPGSGGPSGGMLVLTRARGGAPKAVSKLSVPPPLNLPSLRKEHEKFDILGSGGPGVVLGSGSGSRPTSSGMGWTKPSPPVAALPEKNKVAAESSGLDVPSTGRAIGSYMPPSARSSGTGVVDPTNANRSDSLVVDKAMLLRGDDFPSLQAARPVSSGASQKQKDGLNQKQKKAAREEVGQDKEGGYHLGPSDDMDRFPSDTIVNQLSENGGKIQGEGMKRMNGQMQKQEEYSVDPLPLVRMNPRSDWADDERDTGYGFVDMGKDIGHSNSESYWDKDYDLQRPSVLPHKLAAQNQYDRWSQKGNETGKKFPSEVPRVETYSKDARVPSWEDKELNKWRNSPLKDRFVSQETCGYKSDAGSRMAVNNNSMKENKYVPPHYGDTGRDRGIVHDKDYPAFGRREERSVWHQQQSNTMESFNNRGPVHNSRHVSEPPYRYRGDNFQNNSLSRTPFTSSTKMSHMTDPFLKLGPDKRFANSERSFSEDPFSRDFGPTIFDESDIFSEGVVGVIKKKKDAAKMSDFHDPVRESFEAELERVQKMQELERQRIIEEQERALEQAQREEEDRQMRIREEEERRRKLEEEARQAAWRADQEQVEAIRKAEEQRIAREEEKRRIQLEEDRRKQGAKQKLEELEAKIAKRQAETSKTDNVMSKIIVNEKLESEVKERHVSEHDMETWEDSERMVENVVASGTLDLSSHSTPIEMSSRPYPPREDSLNFADRGKTNNSWKRDGELENGGGFSRPQSDQESKHYSRRRDAIGGGRGIPRKEFYGGAGYMSKGNVKAGMPEIYMEEFGYHKDHRWNPSQGNANLHEIFREMNPDFDNFAERYGDGGWGQGRPGVNIRPYPEHMYPHPNSNDLYNYGRSRYSVRQPRVLPPPLRIPSQRPNPRITDQLTGTPSLLDDGGDFPHAATTEPPAYYDSNEGGFEPDQIFEMQLENIALGDKNLTNASRCDSQSSLSVSSPPTSPPHLSHDELDESGDSRAPSALAEGKESLLNETRPVAPDGDFRIATMMTVSDNFPDGEDEEWNVKNVNILQHQEEYDEDDDGYKEGDEVRERDDEKLELIQNFERLELEEGELSNVLENVVLGFDEGIEVVIPCDDFEKTLDTQGERSFDIAEIDVDIMKESGTVDGFPSDPPNCLPTDDSRRNNTATDKMVCQGCVGHVSTAASSEGTDLAAQQSTSSTAMASQPINNVPSLSSSGSQSGLPVKLQFGLFSGPSLIPSPVPSIQIGSIQMPLYNHPPVGQSLATHIHPSQPPLFQFGQLCYTSPISHEILPMAPQSMSFLQPNMPGHFNMNQNGEGSVANEPSNKNAAKELLKIQISNQPRFISASTEQSPGVLHAVSNTTDRNEDNSETTKLSFGSLAKEKGQNHVGTKSYSSSSKAKLSELESQHAHSTVDSVVRDKKYGRMRGLGPLSGGRGRRFPYAVKNTHMRVSIQDHGMPSDSNGFKRRPTRTFQRTEFRGSGNSEWRLPSASSNNEGLDDKSNYNGKTVGVFARSGAKRGAVSNRTMKPRIESESLISGSVMSQEVSGNREGKEMAKDKGQDALHLRRNASEEDVDLPLQSGIVHVFMQPGIEAPSDEDDFIEVRSKKQMQNDRREQREKEIKAKSRTTKAPHKPRASTPKDVLSKSHNKLMIPLGSQVAKSSQLEFTSSQIRNFLDNDTTRFMSAASQPPIGTPPINSDSQASNIRPAQAGPVPIVSDGGTERDSGLNIDCQNKVMSLSQSQIDEAMKPAQYDSHVSTVGSHSGTVPDSILTAPSSLTKNKSFSSGSSPISSLLAGEKIQFGAVTSPIVHPPTTRAAPHLIAASGSNQPDSQKPCSFPILEKVDSIFFSKENSRAEPLQDCEAEAEASASAVAVAVAAISNDEPITNDNETNSFTACVNGIAAGAVGDMNTTQPQSEESLSVSLPADLSVETPPMPLWPRMPSPQSSSGQMVSHFPTGPPSQFPFYEMNSLIGGPIFAYNPHEESSSNQSQPPKSLMQNSGSLSNWHSAVDSFYGAPAGYPGPFIRPGVQGPMPHMVVYNHFAPVGQYGQVGLSFMGATYIPSGKQDDWKNNVPASSAMHSGAEGDVNLNVSNVQRGAPTMTASVEHLAPGSPLLPMRPPMPMLDVSRFQTAPDLPVHARWGHIPPSPILPVSRPPQSHTEGRLHPQINNLANSKSHAFKIFMESHTLTQSDGKNSSFNVSSDSVVGPFPSQLGSSDPLKPDSPALESDVVAVQTLPSGPNPESIKTNTAENSKPQNTSAFKAHFPKKNSSSTQQGNNNDNPHTYNNNKSRYCNQKSEGVMSHRLNSVSEYSHRRIGYHGRYQSGGADKGLLRPSKVKQIYVAKQTGGAGSTS